MAAGVAGFCSLNLAALATAVEIGVQPLIAHKPDGQPLYAPFPIKLAIVGMMSGHLLFFGFVEALVTALILLYFQKTDPGMLQLSTRQGQRPPDRPPTKDL